MVAARRVLMVLHGYLPTDSRVEAQIRAAVNAGFEVDVVALRRPGQSRTEVVHGARVRRFPLAHHRGAGLLFTAGEYLAFTALAAISSAWFALRRPYHVVQVHNPPDFLVLAAFVPRMLGARMLFDIHDLSSDMFAMRFEALPGSARIDRLLRALERWAAGSATAVITVHEPYRNELIARGVASDKITVVMNSLDERVLPPPLEDEQRDRFRVVYHGTVTPHYGVHLLIDAAAEVRDEIPNLRLEIYGEGDALPALESRTRELGLEDIVLNCGLLPQPQVLRAVQGASAGVIANLPSRLNRFALSTKLFDYVALGVPVISADLPTIREHFSDSEVMFFEAGNAHALAEALVRLARDPGSAIRRVAAARRRYEAYRWEPNAAAYVALLRGLAD